MIIILIMPKPNAAFERYFQFESEDVRQIYSGSAAVPKTATSPRAKSLLLHGKNGGDDGI